jgi:signal transduction histidine kinase
MPALRIGWGQKPITKDDDESGEGADLHASLAKRLEGREMHATIGAYVAPPPPDPSVSGPPPGSGILRSILTHSPRGIMRIAVKLSDSTWLNFIAPITPPPEPLWRPHFYGPLLAGVLIVMFLSVLAVRYAARPLAVLAAAATRLGRDMMAAPVPEEGPREVRAAARAFNEMQTNLRRFVEDRTQMIAAISHDLRTPITRLKLRAEFVDDDEQRTKMLADLDEMEAMIASTLAFARDDATREPRAPVDLAAMLTGLSEDFGATYSGPERLVLQAGPTALKRAFANLLENAQAYAGEARVTVADMRPGAMVTIDDDGPGIPEAELERVFAPFYRVEGSRNRDTGGTGLGLAVTRSALHAHGGDVKLANRKGGGLRATVTLPG